MPPSFLTFLVFFVITFLSQHIESGIRSTLLFTDVIALINNVSPASDTVHISVYLRCRLHHRSTRRHPLLPRPRSLTDKHVMCDQARVCVNCYASRLYFYFLLQDTRVVTISTNRSVLDVKIVGHLPRQRNQPKPPRSEVQM